MCGVIHGHFGMTRLRQYIPQTCSVCSCSYLACLRELIAITCGSWTLISSYSAHTPWFSILDTFRPHELALHNVITYPLCTWCSSVISFENYIVSTHDLVSTTPLDFRCVSIFSVDVTKIIKIKIHCINLFYPIYLFKVLRVRQKMLCVKMLKWRLWIRA